MGNHQLHRLIATKLVEVEFVGQFHPLDGWIRPDVAVDSEGNAIQFYRATFTFQHHFEVPLADHSLFDQLEHAVEQRLREAVSYTHLTLPEANFPLFAEAFDAEVRRQLREEDLTGRLLSDGTLAVEEFHLELARALRHAGPWGQHFPEPLFHGVFQLVEQRVVGERHLKVVLKSECGSVKLDGIAFGIDRDIWPNPTIKWVELAYKLDLNEFRGNETVQLMIAHIEPR